MTQAIILMDEGAYLDVSGVRFKAHEVEAWEVESALTECEYVTHYSETESRPLRQSVVIEGEPPMALRQQLIDMARRLNVRVVHLTLEV